MSATGSMSGRYPRLTGGPVLMRSLEWAADKSQPATIETHFDVSLRMEAKIVLRVWAGKANEGEENIIVQVWRELYSGKWGGAKAGPPGIALQDAVIADATRLSVQLWREFMALPDVSKEKGGAGKETE